MKFLLNFLIISILFPVVSFAASDIRTCSTDGYTVATINGVLTDEGGAVENMEALMKKVGFIWNNQKIKYEYLLNPIHSGGIGDLFSSITQKAFENDVVADYDLIEMLKDASQKVKTQKLLIVAHSQGNFYANSFYDVVTTQAGGVPAESMGVYSVATPSGRVVDNGTRWLTSETDKVIAWVVGNVPFRKIMPPNVRIELQDGDNIAGHGFSEAYLKYSSKRVVEDVQYSLNRLSKNTVQKEGDPCISPPKSTMSHKVQGAILAVSDPILNPVGAGATWALGTGVKATVFAVNTGVDVSVWTYHTAVATAKWTYHTAVVVAVWGYDTTTTVAKTAWGIAGTIGSFTYNALTGALSNNQITNNNNASVILATVPPVSVQNLPTTNTTDNNVIAITTTAPVENQSGVTGTQQPSQQPQTVFVFEPKVQSGTDVPKLVFVGSFPTGGGSAQVMGTQTTAPVSEELAVLETEEEIVDNAGSAMAEPALSTPQCSQTLAVDGCLLATTTVRFEWTNVAGADHYLINKNGEYATTTEKSFNVEIKDFSDYIFEVVAIGADGVASATSSQKVSVATIPIAINEIAWMGTRADWRDEWFEIKNNTGHTIDLSQWKLNAKDGAPYVDLAGNIAPHAYIVFERKINTVLIPEPVVYATSTGLLSNTGDQLSLFYTATSTSVPKMFDQTPDGAWVAGATSTRQTMERYSSREPGTDPENWGTNLGYIKNGTDANGNAVEGTPGEQNSVSTLINKGQDITSDFTLTDDEERYVVPNGIFVNASSTLTIEHGVTISFLNDNNENYGYFVVNGQIVANGTHEDPVVFNSFLENRAGGFWIDNNNGTSTFEYAHFEDINSPITVYGGNLEIKNSQFVNTDGGVESDGTNTTVLIENTNFASSTSDTIGAYNGSAVRISSSTISNTLDGDAIGVYYSTMTIASSTISNTIDGDAIGAYYSKVIIASSTISNTLDGDAIGVYYSTMSIASTTIDGAPDRDGIFSYKSVLDIENSTIRNTGEDAIILSNSTSTISNTIVEAGAINEWGSGIYISRGTATITDTSVSGFSDGSGVYVDKGILSISSSTIKNVADYGIYAYKATTTISNVTVENGGINGVEINQGTATIADTSISGFTEGAGISVSLNRKGNWQEMEAVPGIVANISNSEITGNAIGVEMEVGSAIIGSGVSVQENTKNIVVCSLVGECVEQ